MTREEQIIEKASKDSEIFYKVNDNYGDCFHGGFIDGAKWADEHPKPEMVNKQEFIDKACEWLKRNYTNYMVNDLSKYVEDVCSFDIFDDLLVDDFRKAMEE
jgi:hypothetical protein